MPKTRSRTEAQPSPKIPMTSGVPSPTLLRGPSAFDGQLSDQFEHLTLPSDPTSDASPHPNITLLPADISARSMPSAAPLFPMIIDSPSFAPPGPNTKFGTKRPDRPPMVMSSVVREAGSAGPIQARSSSTQRRVSRFKAERS
jgi:hypothetical protein